jgi:hypothetical protein
MTSITGDAIETALVRHYLRSDGPYGDAPLRFLDVSGSELNRALSGLLKADAPKQAFVQTFSPPQVKFFFEGTYTYGKPLESPVPGWFRFLVLSCVVVTWEDQIGSVEFTDRLERLIGLKIQKRPGIAAGWRRLRDWCERGRSLRLPYRSVVLPETRGQTSIGHSNFISFPSWRDAERLGRVLTEIPADDLRSPSRLIERVRSATLTGAWSEGFRAAFQDFRDTCASGLRLVGEHPFYQAAVRAAGEAEQTSYDRSFVDIHTDVDELDEFRIVGTNGAVQTFVALADLVAAIRATPSSEIGMDVLRSVTEGLLAFDSLPDGSWREAREPTGAYVRLAMCNPSAATRHSPASVGEWVITPPMSHANACATLAAVRKGRTAKDAIPTIAWESGVKIGRTFLGRPRFLPVLRLPENVAANIVPSDEATGEVLSDIENGIVRLACNSPSDGVWHLGLREREQYAGRIELRLRADAPELSLERHEASTKGWMPEDASVSAEADHATLAAPDDRWVTDGVPDKALDMIEALYAAPNGVWDQSALIAILRLGLGNGINPWDALSVIAGAGFAEPRLSTSWRARRWFLSPPRLRHFAGSQVVALDGATGATVRRRFAASAIRAGGRACFGHVDTAFSIPIPMARVADAESLAQDMALPLERASSSIDPVRTLRFRETEFTDASREVVTAWCWRSRRFREAARSERHPRVALERLRQRKDRSVDTFRLSVDGTPVARYDCRASAIVEAHRAARLPMFVVDVRAGRVIRLAADGRLPQPLAMRLTLAAGCGPHLEDVDGRSTIVYPIARGDASLVQAVLGNACAFLDHPDAPSGRTTALARRWGVSPAIARARERAE